MAATQRTEGPPAAGAGRALRRVVPLHRALLLAAVALLGLRLILSLTRSGPVIMADEAGYLTGARVLAGGMPAEMGSSPFYRGGYSLLIAPILSLRADPVSTYHLVLVLNVVLVACLVPLLYLLLTRCLGTSRPAGLSAAVAGAAYPSVTALSQVALSESLLYPLAAAWFLSLGCLMRTKPPSVPWAAATGLCAAALWAVHGRMVVAVALTAVLLVMLGARGRLPAPAAGAGLSALAVGMVGGRLLNDWLVETNYGGRRSDDVGTAVSSLGDVEGILAVLRNLAGQSWYLLIATMGIALVLIVAHVPGAAARIRRGDAEPADHVLAALAATTVGLLLLSSLWFATTTRPDQLIYGRYVEPVVPVLVAVGLIMLARLRRVRLRLLLAFLAGLTLVVAVLRANLDVTVEPSRWNVASLPFLTGQLGAPVIVAAGVVGSAGLGLLVCLRRRGPCLLAAVMLTLFVPTTAYVVYLPVLRSENDVYPAGWESPRPIVDARGARTVAYDLDRFDHIGVKVYQWFMPRTRVVLFHGRKTMPPTSLFISGRTLSGRLAGRGATRLWIDPGRNQAVWDLAPPR